MLTSPPVEAAQVEPVVSANKQTKQPKVPEPRRRVKAGGLLQPRRKEAFDLLAPARPLKACAYRLAFDHDEGRQHADAEPLEEIGALLLFDAVQLERALVAVVLEHLRKARLSAPTCTFGLGVEKHEPRLLRGNDRVSHFK